MIPQQTIAHYRITAKLGEGGMGAVYRATDTKLGRDVALKVLPEAFASDPDRLARFTREAQVLASLNHPNIAAIYGVEDRTLVMELVEGPTLAERISEGPVPLEEALEIARQIGDALEAAHEKGVVHRDLKPANIKVTPEGRVKVLDFGLAKALSNDAPAPTGDGVNSPTLTMRSTVLGMILGTAGYMAPEQAKGKPVDKRADIWAFGVVLYEMLTGQTLFEGETVSDTLAAVLTKEPDWERTPKKVRRLLRACLEKDPKRRLRDISDAWRLLDEAPEEPPAAAAASRTPWIAVAAALAIAALAGWWVAWRATRPADHPLTRLSVDLGPDALVGPNLTAAISPDGRRLVFSMRGPDGKQQLATRLLDQEQATLLPGTEGGFDPFFSPDGQWIGFFTSGQMKKISVQGGAAVALCPVSQAKGGSWGEDGNIITPLNHLAALSRVPAAGGTPQWLTKLAPGELTHRWPQVLPGGEAVLFTASPSSIAHENANIEAVSLKTGQIKVVQRGGYFGRYLPSGHLLYVHQGVLFGVPFDPARLEVRGTPTPLVQDVAANAISGGGQFDFSSSGTLVYLPGKESAQAWQVAWLDSFGKMQPLLAVPRDYSLPRLSPDGRKLAFFSGADIYVHDVERNTTTQLTFNANSRSPIWAPDGKHILFSNGSSLAWTRSDGASEPQRLLQSPNAMLPWSISPDASRLAFHETSSETGTDLWTLPLDMTDPDHPKAGKPEPFLRTAADEIVARFSPDGRWIAYRSNESGSAQIYVRPFRVGAPAGSGGKWQISAAGGLYGIWSNNGRELFYETPDNRIMVVDYTVSGDSFIPGKRRLWSDRQIYYPGGSNLDLAPDGKRFVVFTMPETVGGQKGSVHVTMLENFFDEVRRRIPVGSK
jgi:serine/threonine-protein kinase